MEKEAEKIELVVIDSSIFVDYLRNYQPSISFFQLIPKEKRADMLFSAITETELITGKSCNDNSIRTIILNMLNSFTKIDVNNQIALRAGDLCRIYGIDLPDSIIAATALIHKAELLTRNIGDFKLIKDLKVRSPY